MKGSVNGAGSRPLKAENTIQTASVNSKPNAAGPTPPKSQPHHPRPPVTQSTDDALRDALQAARDQCSKIANRERANSGPSAAWLRSTNVVGRIDAMIAHATLDRSNDGNNE
jgi:hypothetical protein